MRATLMLMLGVMILAALLPTQAMANRRVPAEWAPQAAVWMQWPQDAEAQLRPAFARIIRVAQQYEPVFLVVKNQAQKAQARKTLATQGASEKNIKWRTWPTENSWMRDNGPIYVEDDVGTRIQNWGFDAWGGNWGPEVGYENDNNIPAKVAEYLGLPCEERQDYILEKGNLEVNGAGVALLNWDCQQQRNPQMPMAEQEALLKEALGLHTIIWAYGHDPEDGTTGHIDGSARFINENTVAVTTIYNTGTETRLAEDCRNAGLHVVEYDGDPNWLVGDGFVAAMGSGDKDEDALLKQQLQDFFPHRDIHMVDAAPIAEAGGGIHCVTNDQPALKH